MKLTRLSFPNHKRKFSPVATLLFLLLASAILYACALLVLSVARNSLHPEERQAQHSAVTASPPPSETPEVAHSVAAMRTPSVTASPTPTASVTPTLAPTPVPTTKAQTPAPTLPPVFEAPALNGERADFLLVGMDANSHPDWIIVVRIRNRTCQILSVPRNTLARENRQLADAGSAKTCASLLTNVWPIRYSLSVTVQTAGLATFVDQFGGVTIDAKQLDGAAAARFLDTGPADELLRIARQQTFMRAYIEKLQSVSLFTLLSARFAFEPYVDSSLSAGNLLTLFDLIRNVDPAALSFHTLPVDSRILGGARRYVPDASLVGSMSADWRE